MKKIFGLIQDGRYPNCTSIAAQFRVSYKTACRDLEFMRDRWELPIEYDERKYGYYFAQPVDRFPGVPVTEKELFALCVAHKAIEQYQGTALEQPLEMAFQKCLGRLDDQERFTLQSLNDVLSFRPFAPEDAELRLFELITEAIRERRGLQFEYRKPGEKAAEVRHVHPYHLMQFNHRWYLLASNLESNLDVAKNLDLAKNGSPMSNVGPGADLELAVEGGATQSTGFAAGIRKFVLGRIRAAQMTDERFERPVDFDAKKFFEHSLGVMTGTGDYEVVIEMDAWLTDSLRGRRWHPSQVWTELPGGGAHLQLRLSCLEEIEQWVLSWGTRATVVRPQALATRIARIAAELAARYVAAA
jgi:proteasome accessory factor B